MRARLVLVAVCLPAFAAAQRPDSTATLLGRVVDEVDSGAVAFATISVAGADLLTRADGWGYFRISGIKPGPHELVIRALGYAKLTQSVDLVPGTTPRRPYSMTRVPHLLEQMVVEGRSMRVPRGFEDVYRRGGTGFGVFITREQIDSMNPLDIKAMLAPIPGVYVNDRGVYFQRCPGTWPPQLWIDGQRVTRFKRQDQPDFHSFTPPPADPYFLNELLTGIGPQEVQAIEVYRSNSETPAEFLDGSGCGVLAIWTKRGP